MQAQHGDALATTMLVLARALLAASQNSLARTERLVASLAERSEVSRVCCTSVHRRSVEANLAKVVAVV